MGDNDPKQIKLKQVELYDKPLLNSSVKNSVIFTVFSCNESILLLLKKFVYLLNVLLYLLLVVFFYASDIIASASDKIDGVDRTDLRLIRINDYRR